MTLTIDLERVLTSGKKNSYEARALAEVVSAVVRSKRALCLAGAGISTSAGIPDFRSANGLYELAAARSPSKALLAESTSTSSRRSSSSMSRSMSSCSTSSEASTSSASSSRSWSPMSSEASAPVSVSSSRSGSLSTSSNLKGADMFSTQVFSSASSLAKFYKLISTLNTLSEEAEPTPTHRFIKTLANKGKLLRCYTQNIDGLELRAGLESANPQDSECTASTSSSSVPSSSRSAKGNGSRRKQPKYNGQLVHLHGRASTVRCTVCHYTGPWTAPISQAYQAGYSMQCAECQQRLSVRQALGKRTSVAVGSLRPAITLYGEQGLEDLFISDISNADVRSKPDCLIIFGTSLKVHGFKQLVKDFAREVEEHDGKVIYVNLGEAGKEWDSVIDYHISGTTDTFVQHVIEQWHSLRPQDFETQQTLEEMAFAPCKSNAMAVAAKAKGRPAAFPAAKVPQKVARASTPESKAIAKSPVLERSLHMEDDEDEDTVHVRAGPLSEAKPRTTKPVVVQSRPPRKNQSAMALAGIDHTHTTALPRFERLYTSPNVQASGWARTEDVSQTKRTRGTSVHRASAAHSDDESDEEPAITVSSSPIRRTDPLKPTRSPRTEHVRTLRGRKSAARRCATDGSESEEEKADTDYDMLSPSENEDVPLISMLPKRRRLNSSLHVTATKQTGLAQALPIGRRSSGKMA